MTEFTNFLRFSQCIDEFGGFQRQRKQISPCFYCPQFQSSVKSTLNVGFRLIHPASLDSAAPYLVLATALLQCECSPVSIAFVSSQIWTSCCYALGTRLGEIQGAQQVFLAARLGGFLFPVVRSKLLPSNDGTSVDARRLCSVWVSIRLALSFSYISIYAEPLC